MTTLLPRQDIPFTSVDTPWEPQEIVWRHPNESVRHAALRRQAQIDQGHLVREVWVSNPNTGKAVTTPDEAFHSLGHTKREFDIIRACGITVIEPDWHAFFDDDGQVRILARVAIIDGIHPPQNDILHFISRYRSTTEKGPRLGDLSSNQQYIDGIPRLNDSSDYAIAPHLVDMDSFFPYMSVD